MLSSQSCSCILFVQSVLSLCLDCSGGQSEVLEAARAAWPVPGARQYPGVCTQARTRR